MNFAHLSLRPRAFFAQSADSLSWVWPLVGFYVFAFASYFQHFLVNGYHMPYWLGLYVVAWVPALTLALGLFVLLVLFWYWPATNILGAGQPFDRSTKIVGISLLVPGAVFLAALFVLATLESNGDALSYRAVVATLHAIVSVWALALIVVGAKVSNKLTARQTALLGLWLVLLLVLLVAAIIAIAKTS